jgi:regulator of protease activity HflC (stomatin/prohibitin superfamily)
MNGQNYNMESPSMSGSGVKFMSFLFALVPLLIFGFIGLVTQGWGYFVLAVLGAWMTGSSVRINNQWEQSIILRLGKYSRTVGAGLFLKWPFIENTITRDMRIRTLDIPKQEVITKDNISVGVDAVVFLKVSDTMKSIINIQNFIYAVKQFSQTTLRNVIGQKELDELLERREDIAVAIKKTVDMEAEKWGIDITGIELQNIELPENMKRIMARQAEAERERRAVIIKSKGELEAAKNLRLAADELAKSAGSMELRRLETLTDISQDQSNTIVFAVPLESLKDTMGASSGLQVPKPRTKKKK